MNFEHYGPNLTQPPTEEEIANFTRRFEEAEARLQRPPTMAEAKAFGLMLNDTAAPRVEISPEEIAYLESRLDQSTE